MTYQLPPLTGRREWQGLLQRLDVVSARLSVTLDRCRREEDAEDERLHCDQCGAVVDPAECHTPPSCNGCADDMLRG